VIMKIGDFALHGMPVDMDIPYGHENGNLYASGFEIFCLIHLFNGHYCSIGRRKDGIATIFYGSIRASKKAEGKQEEKDCQCCNDVQGDIAKTKPNTTTDR